MEWKINDLGKVGSLTVVGNMEQINEVNDFLKALANKTENEQSNCNILHVSVAVCPYCKGKKKIFHWEFGQFVECGVCRGSGQTER